MEQREINQNQLRKIYRVTREVGRMVHQFFPHRYRKLLAVACAVGSSRPNAIARCGVTSSTLRSNTRAITPSIRDSLIHLLTRQPRVRWRFEIHGIRETWVPRGSRSLLRTRGRSASLNYRIKLRYPSFLYPPSMSSLRPPWTVDRLVCTRRTSLEEYDYYCCVRGHGHGHHRRCPLLASSLLSCPSPISNARAPNFPLFVCPKLASMAAFQLARCGFSPALRLSPPALRRPSGLLGPVRIRCRLPEDNGGEPDGRCPPS